jgi:hypothetical protein
VEPGGTTTRVDRSTIAAPRHRADTRAIVVGGPLGDQRGLSAAGAVVVLLLLGGVGAIIDKVLGHGLWMFFLIAFVAGVLLNAVRVHIEDLAASIVIVPLTYAIIGLSTSLGSELGTDRPLKEKVVAAVGVMVLSAPTLLLSVAVATVIALGRGRSMTRARRRARARAVRRYGHLPGSRPAGRNARSTAAPPPGGVRRR